MNILICIIVLCFTCIQIIEILSYLSRLSGVLIQKRSMAYTLQNAVFMLTRFFTLALMPILGLLIDMDIDKHLYLLMCLCAVVFSTFFCSLVILLRNRATSAFISIISMVMNGKNLLLSLAKFPLLFLKAPRIKVVLPSLKYLYSSNIFWLSSFVFFSYALSLFLVFFLGLFFTDYRVTLSQTSGMINAFSTILLTFWIEPKLSLSIDEESTNTEESSSMIIALLLGRILGVGLYSLIFFTSFYFYI